jgi:formylglycine-generating enzyme required for sulfatase activity
MTKITHSLKCSFVIGLMVLGALLLAGGSADIVSAQSAPTQTPDIVATYVAATMSALQPPTPTPDIIATGVAGTMSALQPSTVVVRATSTPRLTNTPDVIGTGVAATLTAAAPTSSALPTTAPSATRTPSATPTATFTATQTATSTPTASHTPSPTLTSTETYTPTATQTPSATVTPTSSPTLSVTLASEQLRNSDWTPVERTFDINIERPMIQVMTSADNVAVRSGPGSNASVLGPAYDGDIFNLLEQSGGWYRIGEDSWVSASVANQIQNRSMQLPFVLVPAGCFTMGRNTGDASPEHEQCFSEPFWISMTEITNAQFGNAPTDANYCGRHPSGPDQPRHCVNWIEAQDFCASIGGRLPTEAEWEYAARGPESLVYPWGNQFNTNYAVYEWNSGARLGNTIEETAVVGSRPEGASWVGALDMAGNVREWTLSEYRDYPYVEDDGRNSAQVTNSHRVLRGGGYYSDTIELQSATRDSSYERDIRLDVGFRCVLLEEPEHTAASGS